MCIHSSPLWVHFVHWMQRIHISVHNTPLLGSAAPWLNETRMWLKFLYVFSHKNEIKLFVWDWVQTYDIFQNECVTWGKRWLVIVGNKREGSNRPCFVLTLKKLTELWWVPHEYLIITPLVRSPEIPWILPLRPVLNKINSIHAQLL
jgi:hypothetical protein